MSNQLIKLFENCIIVKGANRSSIIDMQRSNYYLVPNSMAELFDENHVFDVSGIEKEYQNIVDEYIKFLIDNELCFYCDEKLLDNFPTIDFNEWDYPAHITNALIELDFNQPDKGLEILRNLADNLLTRYFEVYALGIVDVDVMDKVLSKIDELDLYSYNLIVGFNLNDLEGGIRIINEHYKISRAIVHSTGRNEVILSDKAGWGNVFLIEGAYNHKQCGLIDQNYFANNIEHITESHQHNTCLNRKIAIDKDGNIKNCLGMCGNHGNVGQVNINEIVNSKDFQKLWHIKKDDISKCKDCEFRHICTDCRAFIDNPEDIYSAPLKCGYDPYTNKWEDWSTLPFKQKAMEFYELKK